MSGGIGGSTARQPRPAVEMAALGGKLRSLGVSDIDAALPSPIGAERAGFILSAFGKTNL